MYRKMEHKRKMESKKKRKKGRKKEGKKEYKIEGKINRKKKHKMLKEDCYLDFNKHIELEKNPKDFEYIYNGRNPERWCQKGHTYKERYLFVTKRANKKRIRRIQERKDRDILLWMELKQRRYQMKLRVRYHM
tara:strand:- start:7636 stop:8034 length:399 start_codon:yes stop_codon:yes gene_type:complete